MLELERAGGNPIIHSRDSVQARCQPGHQVGRPEDSSIHPIRIDLCHPKLAALTPSAARAAPLPYCE